MSEKVRIIIQLADATDDIEAYLDKLSDEEFALYKTLNQQQNQDTSEIH